MEARPPGARWAPEAGESDGVLEQERDAVGHSFARAGGAGRTAGRDGRWARRSAVAGVPVVLLAVAGCSADLNAQFTRLGLPDAASDRARPIFDLWIGTWIAAGLIGVLVWGLILWAALRYRGRSNVMPRQNRYNLPMEIFYTAAPFVVVGVLFYFTVLAQNTVTDDDAEEQQTITVVGYKWSWIFNYGGADNPAVGADVWEAGTISKTPDLYLPVNQTVRFELRSPDVIHSFWVPSFYQKMDVIPGRDNFFEVTPTKTGTFAGKCAELCGTYHSAMLFNVKVVSEQEYEAHLQELAAAGNTGLNLGPGQTDPGGSR